MKKLFTFLLTSFALATTVNAFAANYVPQGVKTISKNEIVYCTDITAAGNPDTDWCVVPSYGINNQKYTNVNNDQNGNPNGIEDNIESTTSNSVPMIKIKNDGNTFTSDKQVIHMHVKGIESVIGHGTTTSSGRGMAISCTEFTEGLETMDEKNHHAEVTRKGNSGSFIVKVDGLDPDKEYIVSFYGIGGETRYYCAEFFAGEMTPAEATAPEFAVSSNEISTIDTAQITIAGKNDLNGVTLTDIVYSTPGIVNVDANGVVTPQKEGTTTVTFKSTAVDGKYLASSGEFTFTVTKPMVDTPVIIPAKRIFTGSVTVTATCATEGATLTYTVNNGGTWTALPSEGLTFTETTSIKVKAELAGYTPSEASAEFTLFSPKALSELTPVVGTSIWDWSKFGASNDGTALTETSTPKKDEDWFVLSDIVGYGIYDNIAAEFGDASQLYMCAQYVYRKANNAEFYQGNCIVLNAAENGKLTVTYANTGNNAARFVNVNGEVYGEGVTSNSNYKEVTIPVSKGLVIISGYDPTDTEVETATKAAVEESDIYNPSVKRQYLRISKLSFEGESSSVSLNPKEEESFVIYDLNGRRVHNPSKGIYIINGKKVLVK